MASYKWRSASRRLVSLIGRSTVFVRRLSRSRTTIRRNPGVCFLSGRTWKTIEPLPNPRFNDTILIQSGWLTTSQKQPAGAETSIVDWAPLETAVAYVNEGLVFRHAALASPGMR